MNEAHNNNENTCTTELLNNLPQINENIIRKIINEHMEVGKFYLKDLAEICCCDLSTIYAFMDGDNISLRHFVKICNFIGLRFWYEQ